MPDIAFVNGRFMPLEEARVSVEDRGYQFGDGVYEVVRTYRRRPFQLDAHLARLDRSAKAIELRNPYSAAEWIAHVMEGLRLGGYVESKVYIQITRGVAPRDHLFPAAAAPTAVMTLRELRSLPPGLAEAGVAAITLPDLRWGRCDVKTINLLPNVLARQRARAHDAFEAILVRGEEVTEGSVSNVMAVVEGVIVTPSEGPLILSGVTRAVVLDLARKAGLPIEERRLTLSELRRADEVFLTGTTVEILPVVRMDGGAVGPGTPGPLTRRLRDGFAAGVG